MTCTSYVFFTYYITPCSESRSTASKDRSPSSFGVEIKPGCYVLCKSKLPCRIKGTPYGFWSVSLWIFVGCQSFCPFSASTDHETTFAFEMNKKYFPRKKVETKTFDGIFFILWNWGKYHFNLSRHRLEISQVLFKKGIVFLAWYMVIQWNTSILCKHIIIRAYWCVLGYPRMSITFTKQNLCPAHQ